MYKRQRHSTPSISTTTVTRLEVATDSVDTISFSGVPTSVPHISRALAEMCIRDSYKTPRGYHASSLNSNGGWNVTGTMSFLNAPILQYAGEIRSAVLVIHLSLIHI